jgi:hypothetical protein
MTRHSSFKRVVRSRMEKTGESYTAARAVLLAAEGQLPTDGPALAVWEEVLRARTGRGWEEWFDLLDESGAAELPRAEAMAWLADEHGVEGWTAQAVRITYQRARGLRAVGGARRRLHDHGVEDGGRARGAAVGGVRGRVAAA